MYTSISYFTGAASVHNSALDFFRPAIMYGSDYDTFINYFLTLWRVSYTGLIHVYQKGEQTYKMPIAVRIRSSGIKLVKHSLMIKFGA